MKARALYHLLEVRAWRLEPIVDAADRAWLEHVRSSLEVAAVDGQYRISWQTSDHRRSEGISQRAFEFYSRGDLATGAESKRAGRLDNWRAATQVWQRIFAVEERAWPEAADAQGMGIEGPGGDARGNAWAALLIVATAGLLTLPAGLDAGLATLLLAAGLVVWELLLMRDRSLRRNAIAHQVLIAAAACLPAYFDISPVQSASMVAGIVGLCLAERFAPRAVWAWIANGAFLGLLAAVFPGSGLALLAAATTTVLLLWLVIPGRLTAGAVAGFLTAVAVAGVAFYRLDLFSPPTTATPQFLTSISLLVAVALLLTWLAWWMIDRLYCVAPWMSLVGMAAAVACSILTLEPRQAGEFAGVSGLAAIAAVHLLRSFRATTVRHPSTIAS